MGCYVFPPNEKAAHSTKIEQAAKLCEECAEVVQAVANGDPTSHVLEELADVVQVVEGLHRMYGNDRAVEAS